MVTFSNAGKANASFRGLERVGTGWQFDLAGLEFDTSGFAFDYVGASLSFTNAAKTNSGLKYLLQETGDFLLQESGDKIISSYAQTWTGITKS